MTVLPADLFVQPVPGHDDLMAFRFDFVPTGKALDDGTTAPVVSELDNGDLLIEGYAAVFDGIDRQGENFTDGAFQRGIKSFLGGQASLCYHHKHDQCLGKVLDLEEHEGKGLWMRARVDHQPESSPLRHIYEQVKKGTLSALSTAGFFKRSVIGGLKKITDMDFTEISVTPVPVHPGTNFAVVAGKALESMHAPEIASDDTVDTPELAEVAAAIERLNGVFDRLSGATEVKALPDGHDPSAASHVADMLRHIQRARSHATAVKSMAEHKGVQNAADAIETDAAKHETHLHRLAAKVGPLPTSYYD